MGLEVRVRRSHPPDHVKRGKHDGQGRAELVGDIDQKVALEIVDFLHLLVSILYLLIGVLQGLQRAVDRVCQAVDFVWRSLWRETAGMVSCGSDVCGGRNPGVPGVDCPAAYEPNGPPRQHPGYAPPRD